MWAGAGSWRHRLGTLGPPQPARNETAYIDWRDFAGFGGFESRCDIADAGFHHIPVCRRKDQDCKRTAFQLAFRFHLLVVRDEGIEAESGDLSEQFSVLYALQSKGSNALHIVTR